MAALAFPLIVAVLAVGAVVWLFFALLRYEPGNSRMQDLGYLIQVGGRAFLKRQMKYIGVFAAVMALLIVLTDFLSQSELGWPTALAFLAGVVSAGLAAYVGMSGAMLAGNRTVHAAQTRGLSEALWVALSGGAIMGLAAAGIALLGLVIVVLCDDNTPVITNGFALGAGIVALFLRSGGGLFRSAVRLSAGAVRQEEIPIPEHDPRNPAAIADKVGDHASEVAGLSSDLLESYSESTVAAISIVVATALAARAAEFLSLLPLYVAAAGIVASAIGMAYVRRGTSRPRKTVLNAVYLSNGITLLSSFLIIYVYSTPFQTGDTAYSQLGPFVAVAAGILAGMLMGFTTEHFTSAKYRAVKRLARNAKLGAAAALTEGMSMGMESCAIPMLVLALTILIAHRTAGAFGVALAALGMMTSTAIVASLNAYGAIMSNAGEIARMASLPPSVRQLTDKLGKVGSSTITMGRGFALGSGALTTVALIAGYMSAVNLDTANLVSMRVLVGLLLGAMFPYFYSSMLLRSITQTAALIISEAQRQFREIFGLVEGKTTPNLTSCVNTGADNALRGMIMPSMIAILLPVTVGLSPLGPDGLAGLLVGAVASGLMLGIYTTNSAGTMENVRLYIEAGHFGGKGSEAYKAALVGDTVGNSFKYTAGPAINVVVKLMAVIALVLAPLIR